MPLKGDYVANGVIISPPFPSAKCRVKLTYTGILAQNGAAEIYAHIGFGHHWERTADYRMERTPNGFELIFPLQARVENFHICFKDSAGNWDNNSGANYTFDVRPPSSSYSFDYEPEVYASKSNARFD